MAASKKAWEIVQGILTVISIMLLWPGLLMEDWYGRTRPHVANYQGGRTYPLTAHTVTVWLNAKEYHLYTRLEWSAFLGFLIALGIQIFVKGIPDEVGPHRY